LCSKIITICSHYFAYAFMQSKALFLYIKIRYLFIGKFCHNYFKIILWECDKQGITQHKAKYKILFQRMYFHNNLSILIFLSAVPLWKKISGEKAVYMKAPTYAYQMKFYG